MHVISRKRLIDFYEQPDHQDAKGQLEAWYYEARHAQWSSPADVKAQYRSASIIGDNRVVFNIAGNKYRLIVRINYGSKTVFVRFIGTHKEYDKINAEVI
jgi:mRNA interferase HigB